MESVLRIACVLAALIAVQAQCPPLWEKVDLSCYRVFGRQVAYGQAAQTCESLNVNTNFTNFPKPHLVSPTSFEEIRKIRQIRFQVLRPGFQLGEGERLPPTTIWLGLRLGAGPNTMWESGELYNGVALNQHWAASRPGMTGRAFDPTDMRLNGQCATIPGFPGPRGPGQGPGQGPQGRPNVMGKWAHQPCQGAASRGAFICEISPPGTFNGTRPTMGPDFNQTTFGGAGGTPNQPQWPNRPNNPGWNPNNPGMNPNNPGMNPNNPGMNPNNPGANPPTGPGGNPNIPPSRPNTPPFNPNRPTQPNQPPNPRRPQNPRPRLYQQQDQGYAMP